MNKREEMEALTLSTGFPSRLVEIALTHAAAATAEIQKKISAEIPPKTGRVALVVCPGNVFTAWLSAAVLALAAGHDVWLKPSVHEPVFPHVWRNSLTEELRERVEIVEWNSKVIGGADIVVAYGADSTIALLKKQCYGRPFIGFGHQMSVGVVFSEALMPQHFEQTVLDACAAIEPFRLQGCLSPRSMFVEGSIDRFRSEIEGRVSPVPEFHEFRDVETLASRLESLDSPLACVGWSGQEKRFRPMIPRLEKGYTRFCPMAQMQKPPLSWQNGGIDLEREFAKLSPNLGPVAQLVRASGS